MASKTIRGEALREIRLRAGLTTKALAEKSGVAESTIEGIEGGRRKNRLIDSTLMALARALDMDVVELEKSIMVENGGDGDTPHI